MNDDQLKEITKTLDDHEKRITNLEGVSVDSRRKGITKQKTLREIIRGRKFNNGSEKLAVIVGYYEKTIGSLVSKEKLGKEWEEAKFEGAYKTNLLEDAKGHYIRVQSDGKCDLTQTGEDFFEGFINEKSKSISK